MEYRSRNVNFSEDFVFGVSLLSANAQKASQAVLSPWDPQLLACIPL